MGTGVTGEIVTGKDMKPAGPADDYPHIAHGGLEPMDIGENGKVAVLADPQGAVFALHEATS